VRKVRVFMSDQGLSQATAASGFEPADLTVDTNGNEITDSIVDGLENGRRYAIRIAMMDEADNVVQFYPSTALVTGTDSQGHAYNCDALSTDPSAPDYCPFAATPDEVLGLLSGDFNCFIASAAYGSSLEPKLDVFRRFRFKILSRHAWGLDFIRFYYKYGPYAARYIHDKPALRAITRGLLWPLYLFSRLALALGLLWAGMISAVTLAALTGVAAFATEKWRARA
jgi:hypothetical protein